MKPARRRVFIVDDLVFAILGNALPGKIHQSIFGFPGGAQFCAIRHVLNSPKTRASRAAETGSTTDQVAQVNPGTTSLAKRHSQRGTEQPVRTTATSAS